MSAAAGTQAATPGPQAERVRAWYVRKTGDILRKYGPGPRVHFHTGLVDAAELAAADRDAEAGDEDALRARLVASQERLLEACAAAWDAPRTLSGRVLDVGCGLGGGSLYWAAEHGARVTALTDVPAHVPWIRQLALRAGVSGRVRPVVTDACELGGLGGFDAAVAIESSCYFDRAAWFRALASLIRPGGRVFVVDCFRHDAAEAEAFDAYWHCRLGTLAAYSTAAAAAGFALLEATAIGADAARFWELSHRHSQARLAAECVPERRAHLRRSIAAHDRFGRAFASGAIEDRRLVFVRR